MTKTSIFLDESGCLGWTLNHPYGKGGSSRYLVLAAVCIPDGKDKHVERIIRPLYKQRQRARHHELKSTELSNHERTQVARDIITLSQKHPDITFHAIIAEKSNVNNALSTRTEALYNHMAEQMLGGVMVNYSDIDFYPDARTLKPKDKNALHNYLETRLAIAGHCPKVTTIPSESGNFFQIQCADILASIVWAQYEFANPLFGQALTQAALPLNQVIRWAKLY